MEVKRSSDTRIRREVVGQMLDYAANAVVYWPVEEIRAKFETTCNTEGSDPEEKLRAFLDASEDLEAFWGKAKTNLQAGKVRMLFVADEIPSELRRIVEFLNEQMDPAEVLAIEIKQYAGQNMKSLIPRVMGQVTNPQAPEKRQWDKVSFFRSMKEKCSENELIVANKILEWAEDRNLSIKWGQGSINGMFQPLIEHKGIIHHTISVWNNGRIQIEFMYIKREPPFEEEIKRNELRERLNKIDGVSIPADKIGGEPPILPSTFKDEANFVQFLEILDWVVKEIKAS